MNGDPSEDPTSHSSTVASPAQPVADSTRSDAAAAHLAAGISAPQPVTPAVTDEIIVVEDASTAPLHPPTAPAVPLEGPKAGDDRLMPDDESAADAPGSAVAERGSTTKDRKLQPSSLKASELHVEEPQSAQVVSVGASNAADVAGEAAVDEPRQQEDVTWKSYRNAQPPASSFTTTAESRPPSSPWPASPFALPTLTPAQPQSTPPQHLPTSSAAATPDKRATLPLPAKSHLASFAASQTNADESDDSPDPLRLIPTSSAAVAAVKPKGKGNGKAKGKQTRSRGGSTEPGRIVTSSSPHAPPSSTSAGSKKARSSTPRLTGAGSALDGTEENLGCAGRVEGVGTVEEQDEEGDDSSVMGVLESNVQQKSKGKVTTGGKGDRKSKASASAQAGPSSSGGEPRSSHNFVLDIEVKQRPTRRSSGVSPAAGDRAPSSSAPSPVIATSSPAPPTPRATSSRPPSHTDKTLTIDSRVKPSSPSMDLDSPAPAAPSSSTSSAPRPQHVKSGPRQSVPELNFVVESSRRSSRRSSSIAPPLNVEDAPPHPSSDLTSVADTVLATSPAREKPPSRAASKQKKKKAAPSSEGETESSASPQKKQRRVPSKASSRVQGQEVATPVRSDLESEVQPAASTSAAALPVEVKAKDVFKASPPKRKRAPLAPMKDYSSTEEESDEEDDEEEESYQEATPKKKARKAPPKEKKPKSAPKPKSQGKGKGKAAGESFRFLYDDLLADPSSPPLQSPHRCLRPPPHPPRRRTKSERRSLRNRPASSLNNSLPNQSRRVRRMNSAQRPGRLVAWTNSCGFESRRMAPAFGGQAMYVAADPARVMSLTPGHSRRLRAPCDLRGRSRRRSSSMRRSRSSASRASTTPYSQATLLTFPYPTSPTLEILLVEPSHTNILSFRSGNKIRFDRDIFVDSSTEPSPAALPSPELFDAILSKAVEAESLRAMDDDEDSLPALSGKSSGSPLKLKQVLEKRPESEPEPSSEEEVEEEEEDDELLREEDEDAGWATSCFCAPSFRWQADDTSRFLSFTFPSIVLAKNSRQWWGARLLSYKPPAQKFTKGGKKITGKFEVEWIDGTKDWVNKADILTSSQPAFFTVKVRRSLGLVHALPRRLTAPGSQMGDSHLDLPPDYTKTLVEFVRELPETYQRIIDEMYPPADSWSDDFYRGGRARDSLAKRARFGELQDEHTEAVQQAITVWTHGVAVSRRSVEIGSLCSALTPAVRAGRPTYWFIQLRGPD